MKFTTLIPLLFNDGSRVSRRELRKIVKRLAARFGGCSDEGITKGQWLDPEDATWFRDKSMRVSVVTDRSMLEDARQEVLAIGKQLQQRAMYFEVRDYDGVQILEIPAD